MVRRRSVEARLWKVWRPAWLVQVLGRRRCSAASRLLLEQIGRGSQPALEAPATAPMSLVTRGVPRSFLHRAVSTAQGPRLLP